MDLPVLVSVLRDACVGLGGIFTAGGVIFGLAKGWPILKARAELAAERDMALRDLTAAQRDLARALNGQAIAQKANDAYQDMVNALTSQLSQIRGEVANLRNEIADLRASAEKSDHKFGVAVRFIYDAFESQRGALHTLPPLPDVLQEDVAEVADAQS